MWLFSKDSFSNFPYNRVGDKMVQLLNGWSLYDCVNKKGEELSMFIHDIGSVDSGGCVQNSLKRMKTLRHPDIVNYVDSCESVKEVHIVTERVRTLEEYLREKSDIGNMTFMSSWGIFEVMRALAFLSENCKLRHNQIRLSTIFVNKSGDWKIGGLDYVCGIEEALVGTVIQTEIYWSQDRSMVDSYGLGCLLWEIYNRTLTSVNDLKMVGSLPGQLVKVFNRLVHPREKMRLSVSAALKEVTSSSGLCDNFYVNTLLFLEEIQIKDEQEKKKFMTTLSDQVDSFPDEINKYKVLPHLLTCHQFGAAGIEVLVPLVKLGKLLEPNEFETKVVPCLIAMFRSSHRGTRVRLLEQLSSFIEHLPLKIVDQEIFPAIILGMTDTNPVVREATIRSVVHLAPKLAPKNLNDILIKHIMNIQLKDEQGGIRTNATVCLAKIAPHLSSATRQTHLLNVLLKCTRDPFTPARLSAVSALAASQHFFLLEDVATKLLPCLSFLTVDSEYDVREHTFKALKFALTRLEEASENPEVSIATENKEAQNNISWTNWAVNLSTRLIKKPDIKPGTETVISESSKVEVKTKEPSIDLPEVKAIESLSLASQLEADEWSPIEESATKSAPVIQGGWDQDPDAFFDNLINESTMKPNVVKKGLKLGNSTRDSRTEVKKDLNITAAKSEVKKGMKIGNATSVNSLSKNKNGDMNSVKTRKTVVAQDDGWGDTDW